MTIFISCQVSLILLW